MSILKFNTSKNNLGISTSKNANPANQLRRSTQAFPSEMENPQKKAKQISKSQGKLQTLSFFILFFTLFILFVFIVEHELLFYLLYYVSEGNMFMNFLVSKNFFFLKFYMH